MDLYEIIGVDKTASAKDIRKAFKKLATTEHPDKKMGDAEAHEKFTKITRAYEVLKDEDLRNKYDMYGEEGLSDSSMHGGHYESWQWYKSNIGIYDDDPEIVTLRKSDFEMSVDGTDHIWFINFYSTHCHHCHDLAPTWRMMAKELEGVIRVGAVNCEDDRALCRMQGIHSYPSLILYPGRKKYSGDRRSRLLTKYAMSAITSVVHDLSMSNLKRKITDDTSGQPWLITFCDGDQDCLDHNTMLKLAAMLDGLVKVGRVDCSQSTSLCNRLKHQHGTFYYSNSGAVGSEALEINSLVAQEIFNFALHQLPEMDKLSSEKLQELLDGLHNDHQEDPWLVHFVNTEDLHDIELRKLPAMLGSIKVGRVNCAELTGLCGRLHVSKFPTFMTFKESGRVEVFYGRLMAHDVAAFAQDSIITPLTSLGPSDFPNRVVLSEDVWFVDFFAPWCPPCMRLLPEFRKAAKRLGSKVNFGTVDCTIHDNLCHQHDIHSYPTTILYNKMEAHRFSGHHSADALLEFIKDIHNPPVISLTPDMFLSSVAQRLPDENWLVDFFLTSCAPCRSLEPEWRRLAKMMKKKSSFIVYVAQVDCERYGRLCDELYVDVFPTIRLYPAGKQGSAHYHIYNGWHRDAGSIQAWMLDMMPSRVETLTPGSFADTVLSDTGAWVVDFYAPWCGHCHDFKPKFEQVAETLDGVVRTGKVNCDHYRRLCRQAGVTQYPSVRLYTGAAQHAAQQGAYGFDIEPVEADEVVSLIRQQIGVRIVEQILRQSPRSALFMAYREYDVMVLQH